MSTFYLWCLLVLYDSPKASSQAPPIYRLQAVFNPAPLSSDHTGQRLMQNCEPQRRLRGDRSSVVKDAGRRKGNTVKSDSSFKGLIK